MSTYSLFGATGTVGNHILNVLFEDASKQIHCLVRSKHKLEKMSPEICASSRVTIFEGDIDDILTMQECIRGTRAILMAAAASTNEPGCRISQDQAESVITALEGIRKSDPQAKLPLLVMLSSAEAEEEPHFSKGLPWLIRKILFMGNSNIYLDLIAAEKFLRSKTDFVSSVYLKPGGMSEDKRTGHTISTDEQQTPISYADFAAAMVEVAETDRWSGKSVSVLTKGPTAFPWYAPLLILKGLLIHFFPSLYSWFY